VEAHHGLTCSLCGKPIEELNRRTVAKQVVGWDLWRPGGGQNVLLLRKETGAVAHNTCVTLARSGRLEQDSLWSE
jgi:hypothetical protein